MSDDIALFAGDVMGTGYHAVSQAGVEAGQSVAVLGLGPVGLCATQAALAAGADAVIAVDTVPDRLRMAESFGATAVHLTEEDPRAAAKQVSEGRGVDAAIEAVGHPDALELACRLVRKAGTVSVIGVYSERIEIHMGLDLDQVAHRSQRPGERDRTSRPGSGGALRGELDPGAPGHPPHEPRQAPQAYEIYDRHEALKIVLRP